MVSRKEKSPRLQYVAAEKVEQNYVCVAMPTVAAAVCYIVYVLAVVL